MPRLKATDQDTDSKYARFVIFFTPDFLGRMNGKKKVIIFKFLRHNNC